MKTGDRKEADLARLVSSSPGSLWLIDREHRTVAISPAAAHLIEYEPHELIGLSIDPLHPERERATILHARSVVAIEGKLEGTTLLLTKAGSERELTYRSVVVRLNGEPYVLGTVASTARSDGTTMPTLAVGADLQADLRARGERNRMHLAETVMHLQSDREIVHRATRAARRASRAIESALRFLSVT